MRNPNQLAPFSWRRLSPRIEVAALCNEIFEGGDRFGSVMDLSPAGLRIERPYRGGAMTRRIQLEFEVPEVDEIVWALGEVCFDRLHQQGAPGAGTRLVRTTGLRIARAASRDLRLLRDYVFEKSLAAERAARARAQ